MSSKLRGALHLGGITALALSLAACGGDEPASRKQSDGFSLFDSIAPQQWPGGVPDFSSADYFGEALAPLSAAEPVRSYAGGGERHAPLWAAAPMTAYADDGYGYAPDYYDWASYEPVYYDSSPDGGSYAWLALAAVLGGVLADSPPDYYFDHYDTEPWVWVTEDRFIRYAEPVHHGYRYYYYAPDEDWPFLVRDPYYSYGYYGDRVAVIYDRDGRVLDSRRSWRQRRAAARYYARARELREASFERPRYGVAAPLWSERRAVIAQEQRQWERARDRRGSWRKWDDRHDRVTERRWQRERAARQYASRRFDDWRDAGYRGQAPRLASERGSRIRRAALQQDAGRRESRSQWRRQMIEERRDMRREGGRDRELRGADWRQAFAARDDIRRQASAPARREARAQAAAERQRRFAGGRMEDRVSAQREVSRSERRLRQAQAAREPARAERRTARQRAFGEQQRLARDENRARARQEVRAQQRASAGRVQRERARNEVRARRQTQLRGEQTRARREAGAERQNRTWSQQARAQREVRAERQSRARSHQARAQREVRAERQVRASSRQAGFRESGRSERVQRQAPRSVQRAERGGRGDGRMR